MGKTAKGALWLDENKTTPYEFFQYFRNIEDVKVAECMKLLTFMELDEIEELTKYKDERINLAKERLAYEVTALVHGKEKAELAREQVRAAFSGNTDNMPTAEISKDDNKTVIDVLVALGQAKSKGEARRLIEGGGVSVDDEKILDVLSPIPETAVNNGTFVLHKGKKVHVKVVLK